MRKQNANQRDKRIIIPINCGHKRNRLENYANGFKMNSALNFTVHQVMLHR